MKMIANNCFMILALVALSLVSSIQVKRDKFLKKGCDVNQCYNMYNCENMSKYNLSATSDGTGICLRECSREECYTSNFECRLPDAKNVLTIEGNCAPSCASEECIDPVTFTCNSLREYLSDRTDGTGFCMKGCPEHQCLNDNGECEDLYGMILRDPEGNCIIGGDYIYTK